MGEVCPAFRQKLVEPCWSCSKTFGAYSVEPRSAQGRVLQLGTSRRGFPGTALHLETGEGVKLEPGFFHLGGEAVTESALEHPGQRRPNWGVLVDFDAVLTVTRTECAQLLTQF